MQFFAFDNKYGGVLFSTFGVGKFGDIFTALPATRDTTIHSVNDCAVLVEYLLYADNE